MAAPPARVLQFLVWPDFVNEAFRPRLDPHVVNVFHEAGLPDCSITFTPIACAVQHIHPWSVEVSCPTDAAPDTMLRFVKILSSMGSRDEAHLSPTARACTKLAARELDAKYEHHVFSESLDKHVPRPEMFKAPDDAAEVFIVPDDDPRFAANGPGLHRGVRAKVNIPECQIICSYSIGSYITTTREKDQRDLGRLSTEYAYNARLLPSKLIGTVKDGWDGSIQVLGNPFGSALGPLINDARGTDKPNNCFIFAALTPGGGLTVDVVTMLDVAAGDELLTDYGKAFIWV